eukprot:GHVU01117474.1.p1 GENE.GHVU01117474.1~~GHVU01117474.1.p1  ORF type:complete len:150 (-),score=40.29 GHVU01117474.1:268-717(-)
MQCMKWQRKARMPAPGLRAQLVGVRDRGRATEEEPAVRQASGNQAATTEVPDEGHATILDLDEEEEAVLESEPSLQEMRITRRKAKENAEEEKRREEARKAAEGEEEKEPALGDNAPAVSRCQSGSEDDFRLAYAAVVAHVGSMGTGAT